MQRDPEIVQYLQDTLNALGSVVARAMFGGYGVYCDDTFFAIVDDDTVYFKVSTQSKGDYENAGSEPFTYLSRGKRTVMSYWRVPGEVLDSAPMLRAWAKRAIEAQRGSS